MKTRNEHFTAEDILEHWRQGKSALDWRPLTTKVKRQWLRACLRWTGLPVSKIRSFSYVVDGNQVQSDVDFFCLLGEVFFGYRGYFGQDSEGFSDCFAEIFMKTNDKELAEKGAKVNFKNTTQVKSVLHDNFHYIVESFRNAGVDVELD